MSTLQQTFPQQQPKFSINLHKLTKLCAESGNDSSKADKPSTGNAMRVIREEEEEEKVKNEKKRSRTAKGWRGETEMNSAFRPMTGKLRESVGQTAFRQPPSQSIRSGTQYLTINGKEESQKQYMTINYSKRKSFYDQLEKEREIPFPVKLAIKKRKSVNKNWKLKISTLF